MIRTRCNPRCRMRHPESGACCGVYRIPIPDPESYTPFREVPRETAKPRMSYRTKLALAFCIGLLVSLLLRKYCM
jgi:hypothetical protein